MGSKKLDKNSGILAVFALDIRHILILNVKKCVHDFSYSELRFFLIYKTFWTYSNACIQLGFQTETKNENNYFASNRCESLKYKSHDKRRRHTVK